MLKHFLLVLIILFFIFPVQASIAGSYLKDEANMLNMDWDQASICAPEIAGLSIPKTEIQASLTGHAKHVIRQATYKRESDTVVYAGTGVTSSELTTDSTDFEVLDKSVTLMGSSAYTYDKSYVTQDLATMDQEIGTYYTTQNLNATKPALPATASSHLSFDNFFQDGVAITTDLDATTDITSNGQPTTVTQTGIVTDETGEGQASGSSFIGVSGHVTQSIGNLNVTDNTDFKDHTVLIDELQFKIDNYFKLKNQPDGIKIKTYNSTITQDSDAVPPKASV